MVKIMPNKLQNMEITSIDLVEAGANQEAEITIVKGKEGRMQELEALIQDAVDENSVEKADSDVVNQLANDIAALIRRRLGGSNDEKEETAPQRTTSKKSLDETVEEVTEVVEETDVIEETEEDVEKGLNSEIIKSLQAQIAELQKSNDSINQVNSELKKKIELAELEEVATPYAQIGYQTEELAKTLYNIKNTDKAIYDEFITVLDNALAFDKSADIYKEIGSSMARTSTGFEDIVKKFEAEGMKTSEAYAKALTEHPELLDEYNESYRG